MPKRLLIVLSTLFAVRGGIPRFNQMLCLAIDQLAPQLGLEGQVISQDDSAEHYEQAGRPWKHLEVIPGGGQRSLVWRTLRTCTRTARAFRLRRLAPHGALRDGNDRPARRGHPALAQHPGPDLS
jgi:hypothetical protein